MNKIIFLFLFALIPIFIPSAYTSCIATIIPEPCFDSFSDSGLPLTEKSIMEDYARNIELNYGDWQISDRNWNHIDVELELPAIICTEFVADGMKQYRMAKWVDLYIISSFENYRDDSLCDKWLSPIDDASCDKQVGHADESCTPDELLEICDTLWSPRYDGSATPGNIFCRVVYDLDLNEEDVRKLGIHLDWQNYAIQSSKDFVDDWGFYQDHAIPDTLLIYPSISLRDTLPPDMKVQISFDYVDESETKTFDESLMIYMKYIPEIIPLPENTWVIMPAEESNCGPNTILTNGVCVVIDGGCEPDINGNTTWCGPQYDYLKIILSNPSAFLFVFGIPSTIAGIAIGVIIWRKRR